MSKILTCPFLFQHPGVVEIASAPSAFYSDVLTSAQFGVFVFFENLVVVILGLCGAAVAFPLQHMADHHPQQAQEEENGHQDEGDVVWVCPRCSIFTFFYNCGLTCWRGNKQKKTE